MKRPVAKASGTARGMIRVPGTGDHGRSLPAAPIAARTCCEVLPRRQAGAVAGSGQPAAAANAVPLAPAASRVRPRLEHPLCAMARANRPCAVGDATFEHTEAPPADSPKIVTLRRSPPNAPMLRCTQRSAACWSISP